MQENERRQELRVRSRGQVLLITEDKRTVPATICDVSSLGMRVETAEELPLGLAIQVEVHGFGASGVVRHCIGKNDKYEVGVRLHSPPSDPDRSARGDGA